MLEEVLSVILIGVLLYLIVVIFSIILGIVGIVFTIKGFKQKTIKYKVIGFSLLTPLMLLSISSILTNIKDIQYQNNSLYYQLNEKSASSLENYLHNFPDKTVYATYDNEYETAYSIGTKYTLFDAMCNKEVPQKKEKIRLYLEKGYNINRQFCSDNKTKEDAQYIDIKHRSCGSNILMEVCNTGDLDTVKFLVENGANVNIRDFNGNNAAIHTLWYDDCKGKDIDDRVDIVYYLIDQGLDEDNQNALLEYIENGTIELDLIKEHMDLYLDRSLSIEEEDIIKGYVKNKSLQERLDILKELNKTNIFTDKEKLLDSMR